MLNQITVAPVNSGFSQVRTTEMGTERVTPARTIWTVGHSNHAIERFLALLASASIELVADVRRFPGSRRYPQFGREALEKSLIEEQIGYRHFPNLGGRRTSREPDSPNVGWRVEAFNAYADHMGTQEFRESLEELESIAAGRNTAVMCAEALPWRCHRRLIADALIARGWRVFDILSAGKIEQHQLTEFARVEDGLVTYPAVAPG